MNTTFKEILKPPFRGHSGLRMLLDADNTGILRLNKNYILSQPNDKRDVISAMVLAFVAEAMNKKYEHGYGEPLHWLKQGEWFECPECGDEMALPNRYCKDCGKRLLPPVKEGE